MTLVRDKETRSVEDKCIDERWECGRCHTLLGYLMQIQGKSEIRTRVKNVSIRVVAPLYIEIQCRKCDFKNYLMDNEPDPV